MSIVLTGDIVSFRKFLTASFTMKRVEEEVRRATIDNSLFLVAKVKEAIKARKFTPNTEMTLALSKGTIPLLKEDNLLRAIGFNLRDSFESEVGIVGNRKATGGVGKNARQQDMEQVVLAIHEGFEINVTEAMRAAVFAALREKGGRRSGSTGGGGVGKIRVPPRRFLTSVFEDQRIRARLRKRWSAALEQAWLRSGVKGGEHKDRV